MSSDDNGQQTTNDNYGGAQLNPMRRILFTKPLSFAGETSDARSGGPLRIGAHAGSNEKVKSRRRTHRVASLSVFDFPASEDGEGRDGFEVIDG